MHIWDACIVTNVTCDRSNTAASKREVIALHIQPQGRGMRVRMPGQHTVTFWMRRFPSMPSWVCNELSVVVGGAHVTPCDIRLTHCCQN